VIHNTCPCCEVARPPHCAGCTFALDCPDACEDFDYVSDLRITDDEVAAVWRAIRRCDANAQAQMVSGMGADEESVDAETMYSMLRRLC